MVLKIVLDRIKRRLRTLASGKTLVWPLSNQTLNRVGMPDSIHIKLTRYWSIWSLALMLANLGSDEDFSET